jgi:hypothetical protein
MHACSAVAVLPCDDMDNDQSGTVENCGSLLGLLKAKKGCERAMKEERNQPEF